MVPPTRSSTSTDASNSATPEEQSVHDGTNKSNSWISAHPSFGLLASSEQGIVILKDNKDKIKFLRKIRTEIDRRKLIRSATSERTLSERNLTPDIVSKHKKQPIIQSCPTFRVPHTKDGESFQSNQLIGYDMDCEETLMDFLDLSSRQCADVVVWERRNASSRGVGNNFQDESDEDPDILDYITSQKWKRDSGQNITGETRYQDDRTGRMRNLHKDSVSITLYNTDSDYDKDFGKASIFHPIMTMKEKLMLGLIPSPGWKKHQRHKPPINLKKRSREAPMRSKVDVNFPVQRQRRILEITKIEIVTKNKDGQDVRKKVFNNSDNLRGKDFKQNACIVSEDEPIMPTVHKCFKDILLQTFPNPNFEIKTKTGQNKSKQITTLSHLNIPVAVAPKQKVQNLLTAQKTDQFVDNYASSDPPRLKKGCSQIKPYSPDKIRNTSMNRVQSPNPKRESRNLPIGSIETITGIKCNSKGADFSDFGVQTGMSYTSRGAEDSTSEKNSINSNTRVTSKRTNKRPGHSARVYVSSPRPNLRAIHSHRNFVENEDNSHDRPSPCHSERFQHSKNGKPDGDATYRLEQPLSDHDLLQSTFKERVESSEGNRIETRHQIQYQLPSDRHLRACSSNSNTSFEDETDTTLQPNPTEDVKYVNRPIYSPTFTKFKASDGNGLLRICSRKLRKSESELSSDNLHRTSYFSSSDESNCSFTSKGSSTSSRRLERNMRKRFTRKWKSNARFNVTSASVPSERTKDDDPLEFRNATGVGDEGNQNFETHPPGFDDNEFIRTLFYDFPLDNSGSSVAISVTLPFNWPVDSLPFDSPHCAYSILNKARKLLKQNFPCESPSSQSEEIFNEAIVPMESFVDIEEIFSESKSPSLSLSSSRDRTELEEKIIGIRDDFIQVLTSGIESTPQMIDREIQACESRETQRIRQAPKLDHSKGLRQLILYILSCGCLRQSSKVQPSSVNNLYTQQQ